MNSLISDIVLKTLLTAGVMKYLRSYLETAVRMPFWDILLKYAWIAAIPLVALCSLLPARYESDTYIYILLFAAVFIIYHSRDFRSARLLMIAILPYFIFSVINDVLHFIPDFYKNYRSFFGILNGFTISWLIGFGIYAQKQNKREKIQRQKEEEEKRILEAQKKELERQVTERTTELTSQKEELEQTLSQLKATQAQLIQSEKLASLGELTAGIAHEIQNPLNFVNNFSELSVDLANELNEEISKIDIPAKDKDYIAEILRDLTQNQEKINHHGKRASNIVKGMLEHSRTSTGTKERTDINALVDEYLRLSYHGLRAKDKSFNADFKSHFDEKIPKIEIVPQDMGRVILNLLNNAFYAVNQRTQLSKGFKPLESSEGYTPSTQLSWSPTVFVSTKLLKNTIEIRIKDNGTGMPDSVKVKIFQPFFTTKPTGEGTGLGLSLAYDIVTKGHGGTLRVESTEGVGTEFIICLPAG
jgi:two-component system, NtrC family, sensor kinase